MTNERPERLGRHRLCRISERLEHLEQVNRVERAVDPQPQLGEPRWLELGGLCESVREPACRIVLHPRCRSRNPVSHRCEPLLVGEVSRWAHTRLATYHRHTRRRRIGLILAECRSSLSQLPGGGGRKARLWQGREQRKARVATRPLILRLER